MADLDQLCAQYVKSEEPSSIIVGLRVAHSKATELPDPSEMIPLCLLLAVVNKKAAAQLVACYPEIRKLFGNSTPLLVALGNSTCEFISSLGSREVRMSDMEEVIVEWWSAQSFPEVGAMDSTTVPVAKTADIARAQPRPNQSSGSSAPYVRRLDLYHAPRSKVGSQTATPRGKNSEQAPPTERLVVTLKRRTGSGGTVARPESVRASARAQNAETVEKSLRQIDRFFGAFSTHPGFPVPNRPDFDRLRSDFRDAVGEVFAARLRRLERPEE